MKVKIAKWGNSLAIRLPKPVAEELALKPGGEVDLSREGNRLVIEKVARKIPRYRLEDLLAEIKPGDKPPPLEDWSAVETPWPDDDWSDIAPTDEEWNIWKREAELKPKVGQKRAVSLRRRA
jgi:antitoxin component of MazEF toxin-antitoxin module